MDRGRMFATADGWELRLEHPTKPTTFKITEVR